MVCKKCPRRRPTDGNEPGTIKGNGLIDKAYGKRRSGSRFPLTESLYSEAFFVSLSGILMMCGRSFCGSRQTDGTPRRGKV